MAIIDGNGSWVNRNGNPVPPENIPKHLKKRDKTVGKIFNIARKLEARMKADKARIMKEIKAYADWACKQANVRDVLTAGNATLSDYAYFTLVEYSTHDIQDFDEHLQLAKEKIDQCLMKWTKEADPNIRAIINNAFKVDKKGKVNRNMLFGLFQLEIKDQDWEQAMGLIRKSIQVRGSRSYLQISYRTSREEPFQTMVLNFSKLDY